MVTDVSEHRLIMLFIEGLSKPCVVGLRPSNQLHYMMLSSRMHDMEDAVPKNKGPSKPFIPQKNKDKNPFQKEWPRNIPIG
jgi:hypothetical protein